VGDDERISAEVEGPEMMGPILGCREVDVLFCLLLPEGLSLVSIYPSLSRIEWVLCDSLLELSCSLVGVEVGI
jgi:hypothetical protein